MKKWAFWNKDLSQSLSSGVQADALILELPIDSGDLQGIEAQGVGTLVKSLYVPDSLVGKRCFMDVQQWGACDLFIDGMKVGSIGKVGVQQKEEERRSNKKLDPPSYTFRDTGEHRIRVRFSDHRWAEEEKRFPSMREYGVEEISISTDRLSQLVLFKFFLAFGGIGGILFALGAVHLLIFTFYPRRWGDLYYVLFAWAFCFILTYGAVVGIQADPVMRFSIQDYILLVLYIFIYSLLTLLYAFLRQKGFGSIYWSLLVGGVLFILICVWIIGLQYIPFLFLLIFAECVRVIITSIRRKDRGSWILGGGAGLFVIYPIMLLMQEILFDKVEVSLQGISGLALITVWALLIPLSMSIYLAYDFATTSKGLQKKLVEVEELNQKNLEQEREKQRILEEKKEELEEKVEERTAELRERKEEVEVAHREITDSINYAQRIQDAVLPEEERYSTLSDHFILFKPRDPVSGDFHWGKQEGHNFYLAAVDCTGHGVPGGFMSMLGVSFLNEIMANEKELMPGEILSRLKERVVNELSGTQGVQAKDGMDMALLKIPIPKSKAQSSNKEELNVEFAGAQNPLYVVRKGIVEDPPELEIFRGSEKVDEAVSKPFRDNSDGMEVQGDKAGIGSEEHGIEHFRTVCFKARDGDGLYIFSDGYADQFGGPKGKKFRYGAFKRLLTEVQGLSMEEQKQELEKQFEEWKGDREQVDDVLVMGVRV